VAVFRYTVLGCQSDCASSISTGGKLADKAEFLEVDLLG
jgi:hypothetical protein